MDSGLFELVFMPSLAGFSFYALVSLLYEAQRLSKRPEGLGDSSSPPGEVHMGNAPKLGCEMYLVPKAGCGAYLEPKLGCGVCLAPKLGCGGVPGA